MRASASVASDSDEALAARLRDLALVELDALISSGSSNDAQILVAEFSDDLADALQQAKSRIAALRQALVGSDPLRIVDVPWQQRASEAAHAGIERTRDQLLQQAEAGRALAKLSELASGLIAKLAEADRRR